MRNVKYKTYEYDSFTLNTVATDQFKNCYLEVNFRQDINECNVAQRNMLGILMRYSSSSYPTNREIKIACENLYDLHFSSSTVRVGNTLISSFGLDFLDPMYVSEKDYLKKSFQFFFGVLENPDIKENQWNEKNFEIIKENLLSNIDIYKEHPTSYASVESKKRLFKDSYTGKRILGTKEEIEALSPSSLAKDYQEMLEKSICEMTLVGNLDMDEAAKLIHQTFYKPSIVEKELSTCISHSLIPYFEETEDSSYNQTQVVQYYLLEPLTKREKDYVAPLFQQITGLGSLSDKLGYYLRVKNSLCYSYYSSFNKNDSYFVIATGVKEENVKEALKNFDIVIQEMKKGKISKEEIETMKKKILTNVQFALDSIYGITENCYNHFVFKDPSFDEIRREIPKVTIKELQKLASKMHKTYTYILKEGGQHERD